MTRTEAENLIAAIVKLREGATNAQASTAVDLYPTLKKSGALVKVGTRIKWNGVLKRAAVDLYDTETNTPDVAPTLWEDISYKDGYRIIPEIITVGLAFAKGEIGWWKGVKYKSLLDANVYTPDAYPAGWAKTT